MAWHLTSGGGNLQRRRFLIAGICGNVALVAHSSCVRNDDQTTFSAVNPGLVLRSGEGHVGQAGEEGNVSALER